MSENKQLSDNYCKVSSYRFTKIELQGFIKYMDENDYFKGV